MTILGETVHTAPKGLQKLSGKRDRDLTTLWKAI